MSLTAEDIQTKQFHVRFRGFDIEEVDTFLERIAENFVLLNEEKKELQEKVEKLEMEINKFYSQEKTFQHAIMSAQRIADEMQEKSRKEAHERRIATQDEIDRLRQKGLEEKEQIAQEIALLEENKSKVKEELRTYLQTYLSWLDKESLLVETAPVSPLQSDTQEDSEQSTNNDTENASTQDQEKEDTYAEIGEIDDLYEKIELNDDLQPKDEETLVEENKEDDQPEKEGEEENDENLTIPDLEGDMLFSLEDPLDEEDKEPEVSEESADDKYFQDIKLK